MRTWRAVRLLCAALAGAGCVAFASAHDAGARVAALNDGIAVAVQPRYRMPDVQVVDTRGRAVRLPGPVDTDAPVVVNFIYTTCNTICSTQTAMLAEVQRRLDARGDKAQFVSFTIDPANDTPQRLAEFAQKFSIDHDWSFYSGTFEQMLLLQQAFDVYRGSKASHPPVVLMRRSRAAPWVRVEGFATPADLLAVYQRLPAAR